ncbi:hypothetical protein GC194_06380 [bacterium]|nr:hypothetical protein [bacterium]
MKSSIRTFFLALSLVVFSAIAVSAQSSSNTPTFLFNYGFGLSGHSSRSLKQNFGDYQATNGPRFLSVFELEAQKYVQGANGRGFMLSSGINYLWQGTSFNYNQQKTIFSQTCIGIPVVINHIIPIELMRSGKQIDLMPGFGAMLKTGVFANMYNEQSSRMHYFKDNLSFSNSLTASLLFDLKIGVHSKSGITYYKLRYMVDFKNLYTSQSSFNGMGIAPLVNGVTLLKSW